MTLLHKLLNKFFTDKGDAEKLQKVVIPSFAIHGIAAILSLALILTLTRTLGSKEYGVYSYAIAIATVIVTICVNGFTVMAVRVTSSLLANGQIALWKGFYLWGLKNTAIIATIAAFLTSAVLAAGTYYFHFFTETVYTLPLICATASVPFMGIMSYYIGLLLGRHSTLQGLLVDNVVKPAIFLLLIATGIFLFKKLDAIYVIFLSVISIIAGVVCAILLFFKKTSFKNVNPEFDKTKWKDTFRHFFLLSGISSINSKIDLVMLGFFTNASLVGAFSATERVAAALYIFMAIMNRISAATFSRLYTMNQHGKLQAMLTKITRWTALISLPVFILIILFSARILSYFGEGFVAGEYALIIMCVGKIISILMGPVGTLSVMTGNEKLNITYTSIMIGVDIILNLILIPLMGISGAAIASSFVTVLWNCLMFAAIKKRTGFSTWIFG